MNKKTAIRAKLGMSTTESNQDNLQDVLDYIVELENKLQSEPGFQYDLMKVFDYDDMSPELRDEIETYFDVVTTTGTYVKICITGMSELSEIEDWLLENGADEGEEVLIKIN